MGANLHRITSLLEFSTGSAVCTENLDPDVVVMKPAKDWVRFDASVHRTGIAVST